MRYCDLTGAFDTYARGGNVTEYLRSALAEKGNADTIIEIAYDLQAGSYVDFFEKNPGIAMPYIEEISHILKPCLSGASSVLDVGTGECTTLASVAARCFTEIKYILGCDISWSRVYTGLNFAGRQLPEDTVRKLSLFVGNIFALPLRNKSIDVVWTSHALEPNGGRERQVLREIFRVARKKICLFEPFYEENSAEGQQRMERLGYIRGLPDAIRDLGGVLDDCIRIRHPTNPLNPTYAFVITPPDTEADAAAPEGEFWACPATRHELSLSDGFMFCQRSGLAYPVIRGIPVLREESAILATALRRTV